MNITVFAVSLLSAVAIQELVDRYALTRDWLEKPAILLSIVSGTFCLYCMKLNLEERSVLLLSVSTLGLAWFGVLRHWLFLRRAKKHESSEGGTT